MPAEEEKITKLESGDFGFGKRNDYEKIIADDLRKRYAELLKVIIDQP